MSATWVTVGILLTGIFVVVGGILILRLHAFLALVLGALIVGGLTSERYVLENNGVPLLAVEDETVVIGSNPAAAEIDAAFVLVRPATPDGPQSYAEGRVVGYRPATDLDPIERPILEVTNVVATFTPALGDVALPREDYQEARANAATGLGQRVAEGFGRTAGQIGILIAMASIIGKCLLDSGAADRIVRSLLRLFGEAAAAFSFLLSGFLLGIPVFFDTVFYLMIPLGKAMRLRTGRNYLLYVLAITSGATMAHSLVPPTPGPLFVAEALGVDVGLMILAGGIVGAFTAAFGYIYATVLNRFAELPLRPSPDLSLEDLEKISSRDESGLPPFSLAILPILLPVILIGGATVTRTLSTQYEIPESVISATGFLGDKNIALVISAAIAMVTLVRQRRTHLDELARSIQAALASGGVIILITAAGGAFGKILQQTGVAGLIRDLPEASPLVIVSLAFLITTAIRTAQGSATVAMITAVGVLSGIAESGQLGFDPVYLALAIGCGSKPIAWMNDSGFWVICKMSGMTEAETLKYVTPMTTCMGLVGLAVTSVGVVMWPQLW